MICLLAWGQLAVDLLTDHITYYPCMQSNSLTGDLPFLMPYNKLFTAHLAYNKFTGLGAAEADSDSHAFHFTDINLAYNL